MKIPILICLLLLGSPLYAKEEMKDLYTLPLSELLQIQVTGSTLTAKNIKTVPSAVTVFSHEEIKRMGFDTLDELMNLVPGFQSYRSSFSSMLYPFSSRGRRIALPASETLIMVDGQRMEEPRTSGSSLIVPKFPLMHVERVEFIRGPGAAVYGSNAMMGVVNIITRSDDNELGVSYGSFNRRQVYLLSSMQIDDLKLDMFGHIEADEGDDYNVADTFGPGRIDTDDPHELANLNIKINWNQTHLNFQHNQFQSENFFEAEGVSNGFNERSAKLSAVALQQDFDWLSIASYLRLSYSLSKLIVNAQLSAPGIFTDISTPSSNEPLFGRPDFDDYSETRAQWHNDWEMNGQNSLQAGIELRFIDAPEAIAANNYNMSDFVNGNLPIPYYGYLQPSTVVQAKSSRDIVGLYGQLQHYFIKTTSLTLGLRYDDFSGIGSRISPRLGIVHEVGYRHSLKLLYGEAFRAPAENELHLQNNVRLSGNASLESETVQSLELIWVAQWPHARFSLGYFDNQFDNSIVQISIGNGKLQYTNADQDSARGLEFELFYELNNNWSLRCNYTYINEMPNLSFRETDQLGSLMVNYQRSSFNINLIASYHDKREMPTGGNDRERITLNDYWQLFGKLSYSFSTGWQAYVQAKNLLDDDYLTPAANAILMDGVPNRGREILAGAILKF